MLKSIFRFTPVLFAIVISLFGTQSRAQTEGSCTSPGEGLFITCSFSSTNLSNTYEFGSDGRLVVQFESILTPFTLSVAVNHNIDPIDPSEFPAGTTCVQYSSGLCDQYDFTGNAGGPNGVPVKNTNYKGLITLTLSYINSSSQTVLNPAFGHAPGDNATAVYSEDILTAYSSLPAFSDPTMSGKTPSLSSVAALYEPFAESDTFCNFQAAAVVGNSVQKGEDGEIAFRVNAGSSSSCAPTGGIRDKTARFTVWTIDSSNNIVFPTLTVKLEGNKFHWDSKNGLNELDLSTAGLASGKYYVTVTSTKFAPQDTSFCVN
jgi:hypothetical protein